MGMRRFLCSVLAMAMVLSMAGCGGAAGGDAGSGPPEGVGRPSDGKADVRDWLAPAPGGTDDAGGHAGDPARDEVPADPDPGTVPSPEGQSDGGQDPEPPEGPDGGSQAPDGPAGPGSGQQAAASPTWFDDSLQAYANGLGWDVESYMVSPASLRAALCLAIEGAEGNTRDELLEAARFGSYEEMSGWYGGLLDAQAEFLEERDAMVEYMGGGSDMSFDIANAVWDNADMPGGFLDAYVSRIGDRYGATAASSPGASIADDVNAWCDESTHGMIPHILDDASMMSAVLANALYVKSSWVDSFQASMTERGGFTRKDGSVDEMDFMRDERRCRYYVDHGGRRYAMFGLEGGLWLTVCLDPDAKVRDMYGAAYRSESTLLDVRMPKLDLDTAIGKDVLCGFLRDNGGGLALSADADFSAMTDAESGWHVSDVVQRTRLKTDEDGLEAAAVTVIGMVGNAMVEPDPELPVEFYMDEPFSFLITKGLYTQDSGALVLFFGHYMGGD